MSHANGVLVMNGAQNVLKQLQLKFVTARIRTPTFVGGRKDKRLRSKSMEPTKDTTATAKPIAASTPVGAPGDATATAKPITASTPVGAPGDATATAKPIAGIVAAVSSGQPVTVPLPADPVGVQQPMINLRRAVQKPTRAERKARKKQDKLLRKQAALAKAATNANIAAFKNSPTTGGYRSMWCLPAKI